MGKRQRQRKSLLILDSLTDGEDDSDIIGVEGLPGVLPELWRLPGEPVETLMARALSAMRTGGHHTTWFMREGDA